MNPLRLTSNLLLAACLGSLPLLPAAPPHRDAPFEIEECTIGVACGSATRDGRPLLWKSRDTAEIDNEVYFNSSFVIPFLAVVNANGEPASPSYMGVNEHGFAIVNSNCRDLAPTDRLQENGNFMRDALGTCSSVSDFFALLDSTNTQRETHACFAVIDSTGATFIFEASADTFWAFNAKGSPEGYLIRSNFSCHDTTGGIEGKPGVERFLRSHDVIGGLVTAGNLSPETILQNHARDFSDAESNPVTVPCPECGEPDSLFGFINTTWSICRNITVSAAVVQGVAPPPADLEPAWLSTMWVLLGPPAATIAVPYWPVGAAPAVADGASTAPLCDRAREIHREIYHCQGSPQMLDSYRLLDDEGGGFWPQLFPTEDLIFQGTACWLALWRAQPPAWAVVLAVEDSLAVLAMDSLNQVSHVPGDDPPGTIPAIVLGQNHPNPFNSGTTIPFELHRESRYSLVAFDLRGRLVTEIEQGCKGPGSFSARWEPEGLASGTYIIRLTVGQRSFFRSCLLVK